MDPYTWYAIAMGRSRGWADNLEIEGKIRAELIGDREISSTNIDVKPIQCHVVLLGIVESKKEIVRAIAHKKA